MPSLDREQRQRVEQEAEFSLLMDFLLADRVMLLSEADRKRLHGTHITINDLKDTSFDSKVIQEVDLTIIDGATFMWDRRRPAAIAIGRIKGQEGLILTGAVFSPRAIGRAGINLSSVHDFPALIGDVPGHFSEFADSLGFYITAQQPHGYHLTFGGEYPESLVSRQISGRNKMFQIARSLSTAVGMNVRRT